MGLLEPWHLIVVVFIVLLVFGPGKLPEVGSSLGRGIREFKKSVDDGISPGKSATEQPVLASRTCPSCGQSVHQDARTCQSCGVSLTVAPVDARPTTRV